jgi:hypothetical protein
MGMEKAALSQKDQPTIFVLSHLKALMKKMLVSY